MVISYVAKIQVLHFTVTIVMISVFWKFLNLVVAHAPTSAMWQSRTTVADLSFTALNKEIPCSTPTNQESLLCGLSRRNIGRLRGRKVFWPATSRANSCRCKIDHQYRTTFLQIIRHWEKVLWKYSLIIRIYCRHIGTINASNHIMYLKRGQCAICQQPYCTMHWSRKVLCEHKQKQMEAGVILTAQSSWASPIL